MEALLTGQGGTNTALDAIRAAIAAIPAVQGPAGPAGATGPQGPAGADATINGVNALTISAGNNVQIAQSGSTLTVSATDTTYAPASESTAGLMSAADKTALDQALSLLRAVDLYRTASGGLVTITNAAAAPVRSLTVQIGPGTTGVSGVTVTRAGRNLWANGDVTITSYTAGWADLSRPLPAGTYTFSARVVTTSTVSGPRLALFTKTTNDAIVGTFVLTDGGGGRWSKTVTITGPANYYRLFADRSNALSEGKTVTFEDAQIERGDAATEYAAYAPQTVTVSLGETVYGGTLDLISGVLTITHDSSGDPLSTPTIRQITPHPISTLAGVNTLWADTGDVSVQYQIDLGGA